MQKFFHLIVLLCALTGGIGASADQVSLEQIRLQTAYQLAQYPENRALRFRYAKASFHSGNYEASKFHLTELMRSSTDTEDLAVLKQVRATVLKTDPFSFGLHFTILPSTNIARTSSNQLFDTLLGTFLIVGGGQEETGVGFRLGAQAAYEVAQPDWGSTITYTASLSRSSYPIDRLNNYEAFVGATWGKRTLGGFAQITPYAIRTLFDDTSQPKGDSTRAGLRYSYEHYLGVSRSITGAITAEHRNYNELDYLDGQFFSFDLSYVSPLSQSSFIELGAQLSRSAPESDHLKYGGLMGWAEITRRVPSIGTIGLSGSVAARNYDGVFPASTFARQDRYASIGVSFTSPHIKVWNTSPKITCQITQNWSNIALYDYRANDCAIGFVQNF